MNRFVNKYRREITFDCNDLLTASPLQLNMHLIRFIIQHGELTFSQPL